MSGKKIKFFYSRNDELISLIYSQSDEHWTNETNLIAKAKSRTERRDGLLFQRFVFIYDKLLVIFSSILISMPIIDVHLVVLRNINSFTSRQSQLIRTFTDAYRN